MKDKPFDISSNLVRLLFLCLVGGFLFVVINGLLTLAVAFVSAFLLAFLISPILDFFESFGLPRIIGVIIVFLIIGAGFYILLVQLIPAFKTEFGLFFQTKNLIAIESRIYGKINQVYLYCNDYLPESLLIDLQYKQLKLRVIGILSSLFPKDYSVIGDMLTFVLITPVILIIFLLQGDTIYKRIIAMAPNRYLEMILLLEDKMRTQIQLYLKGLSLQWLIFGSIFSIALWLSGIPYAPLLGFVAATCNIIPYIGPLLGIIPALVVALIDPSLSFSGIFISMGVTQLVDNALTQPLILAGSVKLHPLIAILTLITLQQYFGIIGMIIAIPIASIVMVSIEIIYKQMKAFGIV